jgi:hypothetical protein
MAALFLFSLALVGWQAVRTKPLRIPSFSSAWKPGEQLFPIAAPSFATLPELPRERAARHQALLDRAVLWPGTTEDGECSLFLRTSSEVWARRDLSAQRLERLLADGPLPPDDRAHLSAPAFLDDDDGDGDPLDVGELTRSGPGAEIEIFCPRPQTGELQP